MDIRLINFRVVDFVQLRSRNARDVFDTPGVFFAREAFQNWPIVGCENGRFVSALTGNRRWKWRHFRIYYPLLLCATGVCLSIGDGKRGGVGGNRRLCTIFKVEVEAEITFAVVEIVRRWNFHSINREFKSVHCSVF